MADFSNVPIVDVHIDNYKEIWPTIILALKTSTFVAIDTELSGLGNRKRLNAKSVEDRYTAMSDVAKTHSVLSLGLSCFNLVSNESNSTQVSSTNEQNPMHDQEASASGRNLRFTVQTFNIVLLCSEEYVVEPGSLRFLVDHGFDFNKQYSKGIPYYRGNDQELQESADSDNFIRNLYSTLVFLKVPVVFHNAMVDIVFLYHSFYAALPPGLATFLADSAEVFSGGIYDTKYLAEFHSRMPASFLEYVFRRCQRENFVRSEEDIPHVGLTFLHYPENIPFVTYLPCEIREKPPGIAADICHSFAAHGWCKSSTQCQNSHDIDLILEHENILVSNKKRRRKRKHKNKQLENSDSKKKKVPTATLR